MSDQIEANEAVLAARNKWHYTGQAHPPFAEPVAADEESMEKRIAAYIRDVHEIEAEYRFAEEDDLYLKYMFTSDEQLFPEIPLFVDTEPSNEVTEDDKTVITERRVTLSAFYVLPPDMKTMENRQYLLELIN